MNNLNQDTNPFGKAGYARAVQRGTDTVIQVDSDGPDGFKQFVDVFVLKNVTANTLTPANFRELLYYRWYSKRGRTSWW